MKLDLPHLEKLSTNLLQELVTPEGIFASSSKGAQGSYYGLFGRDSTITAAFIYEAEKYNKSLFLPNAVKSVLKLSQWQGMKNDAITREAVGKIPHEIRENPKEYEHLTKGRIARGLSPFYVDPKDHVMKNWDSNDSTSLWIIVIARLILDNKLSMDYELQNKMKNALGWCLQNIKDYGGFAGYKADPHAKFYELPEQGWKDKTESYLLPDGTRPDHPIRDVAVNAWMWSALMYGSKLFAKQDKAFSTQLSEEAHELKIRFNSEKDGFLMEDEDGAPYFAEAIDGNGNKMPGICADPALALWAYVDDTCIIDEKYIPAVVQRIMSDEFFDQGAGVRNYNRFEKALDPTGYHRGQNTFWPFISGLIAIGFSHFGYKDEAEKITKAMLTGITHFNSCIEMFLKNGKDYMVCIKDPVTGNESCHDQAWSAGAIYYAVSKRS